MQGKYWEFNLETNLKPFNINLEFGDKKSIKSDEDTLTINIPKIHD